MPDDVLEDGLNVEGVRPDSEGEDDLETLDLGRVNEAVVAASDWTTETIVHQLNRGNIDLYPGFQRRDAWTPSRKSKFIESLILGLPIPQLVLAENKLKKGSYIIIDGKQRLLSLRQFSARSDDVQYKPLKVVGLEIRSDLIGKTLEDLEGDPSLADDLRSFQNQTIRTVVIKGWPNEAVLYLIFLRLNAGSLPLSPQELRQALHPGAFLAFVDEESGRLTGLQKVLNITKPDFRMRDAELMVRYFGFLYFLPKYRGNLKAFLDNTCADLNKDWKNIQGEVTSQLTEMNAAFDATFAIFGEQNAFKKWDGHQYERRFNRAVFDIMMFYFSDPRVRKRAVSMRKGVENDFKTLCAANSDFLKAIESTTKSLDATASRLRIWGQTLAKRTKIQFGIPRLQGNAIEVQ
jgi:hypothetical protein